MPVPRYMLVKYWWNKGWRLWIIDNDTDRPEYTHPDKVEVLVEDDDLEYIRSMQRFARISMRRGLSVTREDCA